jgi:hypothetical protein
LLKWRRALLRRCRTLLRWWILPPRFRHEAAPCMRQRVWGCNTTNGNIGIANDDR